MELKILGSSSKGNGYVLEADNEALIIEAGVKLLEAKKAVGFNISKVVGCIVTHQHNDHAGYVQEYAKAGVALGKIYIVFAVLMMFATMWAIYLFPYIARFENQTKMILKNAALIALGNLWKTLLLFVLLLAAAFAVYIFPPAVFIIPCVYMLLANFILEKIFQKYMSPEDLEAEKERNMEYFN